MFSLIGIPNLYEPTIENEQIQASIETLRATNPAMADSMGNVLAIADEYKIPNWVLKFMGNCFSLMGALMMWNLQKRGFYIYAAAEIIPTVISLFISGLSRIIEALGVLGPMVLVILIIAILLIFLFDIAFIVMFGVNMKHMH